MDVRHTQSFSYNYTDDREYEGMSDEFPLHTSSNKTSVFEDCAPWNAVLTDFIRFLEGIYGYNISEQVQMSTISERIAKSNYFTDTDEDDLK